MALERRDRMRHQRARVDARVGRVRVLGLAPEPVQRGLEPVGELPVAGVGERRGADHGRRGRAAARSRPRRGPRRGPQQAADAEAERRKAPRCAETIAASRRRVRASHRQLRTPDRRAIELLNDDEFRPRRAVSRPMINFATPASLRRSSRRVSSSAASSGANISCGRLHRRLPARVAGCGGRAQSGTPRACGGRPDAGGARPAPSASSSSITATIELGSIRDRATSSCWALPGCRVDQRHHAEMRRAQAERLHRRRELPRDPLSVPRQQEARRAGQGFGWRCRPSALCDKYNVSARNDLWYKPLLAINEVEVHALSSLTRWVLAHKRTVVVFWVLLTIVGIGAAGPASDALSQEFSVPGKEGYETNVEIAKKYGNTGGDTAPFLPVVTLPAGKTVDSPGVRAELRAVDARVQRALPGARIASYASTGDRAFVSANGRTTFAIAFPRRDPNSAFGENPDAAKRARAELRGVTVAGAPVHLTGYDALVEDSGEDAQGPGHPGRGGRRRPGRPGGARLRVRVVPRARPDVHGDRVDHDHVPARCGASRPSPTSHRSCSSWSR